MRNATTLLSLVSIWTHRRDLLFTLLLIFVSTLTFGQKINIKGSIVDGNNGEPIIGATVSLLKGTDSLFIAGEISDIDGKFTFQSVRKRQFLIQISYLGYQTLYERVNSEGDIDLGVLSLIPRAEVLDEIVVEAEIVTGEQRGDTVAYNAAAFTTLKDANSQELISKMPGIVIIDGQIQAEGEAVQKILVDGQEFFGGDVTTALQSLPAEVVKSIEIYDQKSDKARLSGFDDGNEVKAINIVTKASKKVGQFGKGTVGYGTDDRYQAAASVNFFNDNQRWTVTGITNNINLTDFTADPNSQGEERTQDGEITTNNIGLQYSNKFFNKLEISGNYNLNSRFNQADAEIFRDYILPGQENQTYDEFSATRENNLDHRINFRMEYKLDKRNTLIFLPSVKIGADADENLFVGTSRLAGENLNKTTNNSTSENLDNDYRANLLFNHKFLKPGRVITVNANTEFHENTDDAFRNAENIFYDNFSQNVELLDQNITRARGGFDLEGGLSFVEPINKKSKIEFEYEIRNRKDQSDRLNYDLIEGPMAQAEIRLLDTALSNVFDSRYITNEAELGYQFKTEDLSLQVELQYQRADLRNEQEFPLTSELERTFYSVLPSLRFKYQVSETANFEFNYYTWTREPRVGQLQEVVDNTNPLQLRVGNPQLDQEFNNRWRIRYRVRNKEKESSFYLGLNASLINDKITSTTLIAEERFMVNDEISIEKGSQLITQENLDGNWDIRTFVNYGLPIKPIKSNFNIWTGVGYRQLPGKINGVNTFTNTSGVRVGLNLSSNISDKVDFNLSTRSGYSIVENSLQPQLNNNFFTHSSQVNFKAIIWKGIIFRTDVRHQFFNGLADGIDNSFLLVNGSIGKRILKDDRGEISLRVFDLLQQNNNIDREITELFIEDSERTVLQRYFMLSFTYNLRRFNGGLSIDDFDMNTENKRGRRRGRRR